MRDSTAPDPSVGRIVHYFATGGDFAIGAAEGPHAAIVTRVWSLDTGLVNLVVFPGDGSAPLTRTSVYNAATAHERAGDVVPSHWDWPARV